MRELDGNFQYILETTIDFTTPLAP